MIRMANESFTSQYSIFWILLFPPTSTSTCKPFERKPFVFVLVSQTQEWLWVTPEGISWDHMAQPSCLRRVTSRKLLRTTSRCLLNIFREEVSITSLHLGQCLVTLTLLQRANYDDLNDWLNNRPWGFFKMFKLNYASKRWSKYRRKLLKINLL